MSALKKIYYIIIVSLLLFTCCPLSSLQAADNKQISIFVSIAPQAYFAEKIGGSRLKVHILLPSGQSPATYSPTPRQMARLSRSKIFFSIDLPFEKTLIPKMIGSINNLQIINTSQDIPLLHISGHHHGENHGNELDPHTWMNPLLAIKQAGVIFETLARIDPRHRQQYEKNHILLVKELTDLHQEIKKILLPFAGKTFFVFHPAYGYFAQAYNLRQKAIETNGKEPSARHLTDLLRQAEEEKIKVIFVQPQFSKKNATVIARAIDASIISLDPLATDYSNNLKKMALAIKDGLKDSNKNNLSL